MKDHYPSAINIPEGRLIAPSGQPDYTDWPQPRIPLDANLGDYLSDRQVRLGREGAIAAIHAESGKKLTFGQLAEASGRLARGLVALGIRPGDRVAYRTVNTPEFLIVMAGALKAGAVVVPVPASAKCEEIRFLLEDTGARVLFVHARAGQEEVTAALHGSGCERVYVFGDDAAKGAYPSWQALLDSNALTELPAPLADAPAILWHTGGTTGRPKACYHTHRRYIAAGMSLGEATAAAEGQRWSAMAPVGHALGLIYHTSYSMMHGATVVLIENYARPEAVLGAVERWRIDTLTGLSVTWAKMLQILERGETFDLSSLRRCYAMWQSASSSQVYDAWLARGVELLNNFGSTAFATWVLIPPLGKPSPRASLGRAAPGYEVAAVQVVNGLIEKLPAGTIGQMAVRGPSGLTYWNRPDFQKRDVVDGWTLSDDLIMFDENGYAMYLGRTDYMISSAGHKVAPVEVEAVLSQHPAVREVSVVGAPCPIRQEIVAAFVVLHESGAADDILAAELMSYTSAQLGAHKRPRLVRFIEALPRDSVGKVQTRLIKQWADAAVADGNSLLN